MNIRRKDGHLQPPQSQIDVTTGSVVSAPRAIFMHPKINAELTYAIRAEGKDILLEHE